MRSLPALRGIMIVPTWTEDRAMLGSNPSAVPGAHTPKGCGVNTASHSISLSPFGMSTNALNPPVASHATVYLATRAVSFTPNQHRSTRS